jgi:hypothetical protein
MRVELVGWFGCWVGGLNGSAADLRDGRPRKRFKSLGIRFGSKKLKVEFEFG